MKQEPFLRRHEADWQRLQQTLDALDAGTGEQTKALSRQQIAELPRLYRNTCHHLALARGRAYGPRLLARLAKLVGQGHRRLYQQRPPLWPAFKQFIAAGFPRLVRKEWRAVLAAGLVFFGPLLGMLVAAQIFPQVVYTVVEPWQIGAIEDMYEPDSSGRLGASRESESDLLMFGFYIQHNTSIGFQTFAGGLIFGLGSLFYLIYNGVFIGAIAGHLTQIGYIETFWGFVAGHGGPELTAIMLSGAAGLRLGLGLIAPGRRTRVRALRETGREVIGIVYGAALLFLLAAFIEAFWSSMADIPALVKYWLGAGLAVLLWIYLLAAGRRHAV